MANNKRNRILDALKQVFSGENTKEGEEIFDRWFHSHDDSQGYLSSLDEQQRKQHKKRLFRSIQKETGKTPVAPSRHPHRQRGGKLTVFSKVAAILLTAGVLSLAGYYISGGLEPVESPVVMVERSNPVGQISEITLPDGSTVWLSAASSIEYPDQFSTGERIINLYGEAFFDVLPDSGRPFVVNSGPVSTSVLGTSFNVRAYNDDPDLEVTLATGKVEVAVSGSDRKQILEPNQKVGYTSEAGLSDVSQADARLARAWTQRELVFMRENFATIARTFERWFGVEFVFEDETLKEEVFVYHFKELSLQNSMIILSELAEFEYEITGRQVMIRKM